MAEKESRLLNYFRSNEELQNAVDRKDERITILLRHNKDLETDIVYREKLMEENTSRLIINLKHAKQRNGRLEKEKKIIEKRHKKSMNALQKELDYMKSAHAGPAHNRVPVSPETNGPLISHRNNSRKTDQSHQNNKNEQISQPPRKRRKLRNKKTAAAPIHINIEHKKASKKGMKIKKWSQEEEKALLKGFNKHKYKRNKWKEIENELIFITRKNIRSNSSSILEYSEETQETK
eukprot:167932_1